MKEDKKDKFPTLGLRCKKCGAVYMGWAMAYSLPEDSIEYISEKIKEGDEPFISYEGVKLSMCKCKSE